MTSTPSVTRTRILDAARELFHQRGYHQTSLAAISERAEANPGSLYYFFKTKEELLVAVLERYQELLWPEIMEPAFAASEDPLERIFLILGGYREMLRVTHCSTGCPIGNLALEITDPSPQVREKIAANLDGWAGAVEQCLDDLADRLPEELDRGRLSRFVLTVMEGGVLRARGHGGVGPFDEAVAELRNYITRLLDDSAGERSGADASNASGNNERTSTA